MNIFVTGATGMIGSFLVEALLNKGHTVKALVRPTSNCSLLMRHEVELIKGDITRPGSWMDETKNCDVVFHVAAIMKDWGPKGEFMNHNVLGTENVLGAIKGSKVKKFIYVSTRSVMGMEACNNADETWPYRFSNVYGYSKVLAEKKVVAFQKESDIYIIIIRPTWVIGPRDRYSVRNVIALVKNGKPVLINGGEVYQSFIHPKDVADALLLSMEKPHAHGQIYLIDSGERRTIRELFELFGKELSISLQPRNLPYRKALIIGHVMQFIARCKRSPISPPLTPIRAKILGLNHTYNISKAKKELGFTPQFSLEDMVHEAVQWWKEENRK